MMVENIEDLKSSTELDFLEKRFDEAIEKYQKVLTIDPEDESSHYKLAQIFAIRGQIHSMINQYFSLIDILESRGDLRAAAEVCNSIIKLDPENINARMKSILLYQKMNKPKDAISQSLTLARLLIELGQGDQSIKLLKRAEEADPENLEIGLELAEVYMSYGQIQEAVTKYQKVAELYFSKGMLSKAADVYRRLKLVSPSDVGILLTLGKIYIELDRLNEAEAEFRTILRYDLSNLTALKYLSLVCQRKGQFKDSILACNKILSIEPNDVVTYERLSEAYIQQGELTEAVKQLLGAARIYQGANEVKKGIKLYQKVLIIDPTNPTACRELTNLGAPLTSEEAEAEVVLPEKREAAPPFKVEITEPPIKETIAFESSKIDLKMPGEVEKRQLELIRLARTRKTTPSGLIKAKRFEEVPSGLIKARKELGDLGISGLLKVVQGRRDVLPSLLIKKTTIAKESLIPSKGLLKPKYYTEKMVKPKLVKKEEELLPREEILEKKELVEAEPIPEEALKERPLLEEKLPDKVFEEIEEVPPEAKVPAREITFEEEKLSRFLAAGDILEAINFYKRHLEQVPADKRARFGLAQLYFDNGLLSQCVAEYKYLVKETPKNLEYYPNLILALGWLDSSDELINTYWKLIEAYKENQDFENLMETYQKILLIDENNDAARLELAELYINLDLKAEAVFHYEILAEKILAQNKTKEAISIYEKIYEYTKDISMKCKIADIYETVNLPDEAKREYLKLADLYKEKGMVNLAADYFHKVIELDWSGSYARESLIALYKDAGETSYVIEEMFNLGEVFLSVKNLEKARAIFEEILKMKEDYIDVRQRLIDIYLQLGLNEPAVKQAEYVISRLKKAKEYGEAIEIYKKLTEKFPSNVTLRRELSEIYILSQEKDNALKELEKIIRTLGEESNWKEMSEFYKKAIELDEKNSEFHYKLGLLYMEKLNNNDAAIFEFEKSYICDPSNLKAGHYLVSTYLQQNKSREAMKMLNQLIEVDSSFAKLKQDIEEHYRKIVENDPSNFQARFILGVVYLEQGKMEEAIEQFQQARKFPQLQAASYNMLGICFVRRGGVGMVELAIRQFKKGLEVEGVAPEEHKELKENLANLYFAQGMHQQGKELIGG